MDPRSQVTVLFNGFQALAGDFRLQLNTFHDKIGVRLHVQRPTLPRNWCKSANPNLSARLTISVLAKGTSMPDSMMVVHTKISISCFKNFNIIPSKRRPLI